MDYIRLKNMVFYAYHGVEESEKILGARFEVDLKIGCDLKKASESDRLEDTINYEAIYQEIKTIVTEDKKHLIESIAGMIARKIKSKYCGIENICVVVRKPSVPIKGILDTVEVEINL
ncbi:MAG: dihydroneopterin aldolase [Candidatus Marinimicrobia bacterium]|jgi:dihydroneopterin aldolase|nr:dihydroneopterin aldolase [Candidatus Neomarinimicrobiota bacterium]MDD4961199.1 dihydroneopterin aldolase [Candidatus Neomarinimicrobiota bacterium]MDD5709091.1 dihydroneopterin aldolase [Candidatus Neomarinimicrobiota bacterium]MDX9778083.1 dihydroneopterin aldolase [bacterium]